MPCCPACLASKYRHRWSKDVPAVASQHAPSGDRKKGRKRRCSFIEPCQMLKYALIGQANANPCECRETPCAKGFAPVRERVRIMHMAPRFALVADNAQAEISRRACFRARNSQVSHGHSTEGALPANLQCGRRERGIDSVSRQTEVCGFAGTPGARGCRQRMVRILCVPSPNSAIIAGTRSRSGTSTPRRQGWELNSHPWNRKTVTPIPASTGAAFGRFPGPKIRQIGHRRFGRKRPLGGARADPGRFAVRRW